MKYIYNYAIEIKNGKVVSAKVKKNKIIIENTKQYVYEEDGLFFSNFKKSFLGSVYEEKPNVFFNIHDQTWRINLKIEEATLTDCHYKEIVAKAISECFGDDFKFELNWEEE